MTIQHELDGSGPMFVREAAIRNALQVGPWLWPRPDSARMHVANRIAGTEPTTRVGETVFVTVRDGQVSLWLWTAQPHDGLAFVPFHSTASDQLVWSREAVERRLPFQLNEPRGRRRAGAWFLDGHREAGGRVEHAAAIDGPSAGLALFLGIASECTNLPLPPDLVALASIDGRGDVQSVDGLEDKIDGLAVLAPRVRRLLVHEKQEQRVRKHLADEGLSERFQVFAVGSATHALEIAFGTAAMARALAFIGEDPEQRQRSLTDFYRRALGGRGEKRTWAALRRAIGFALEHWPPHPDPESGEDERNQLLTAHMICVRHEGSTGEFECPDFAWVDRQHPAMRLQLLAEIIQQAMDFGDARVPPLAQAIACVRAMDLDGFQHSNGLKMFGAYGRYLAMHNDMRGAWAYQRAAFLGFHGANQFDECTYSLSEAFRLAGGLQDPACLAEAESWWQSIQYEDLGTGALYIRLNRARALVLLGRSSEAVADLEDIAHGSGAVTHVSGSALRWLVRARDWTDADHRLMDELLKLPGKEHHTAVTCSLLMKLDAAVDAGEDAVADAIGRELCAHEPVLTEALEEAARSAGESFSDWVARWYPY